MLKTMKKRKGMTVIHGDFSELTNRVQPGSVVLDNADFCCGWEKTRECMFERLRSNVYADKAIVRMTLSARGSKQSVDDFTNQVLFEYACIGSLNTEYTVKPIILKDWAGDIRKKGFCEEDTLSPCYTYFPMMTTFIFLVTRVQSVFT